MHDDFEQFGIPTENIEAAQKWAKQQRKRYEYHTQVPTRKEVLTLPADALTPLVVGWMVHSPIEIVPSHTQIEQVLALLKRRDDTDELKRLISMCEQYVKSQ